jgi:glycosyltransferase involved in cell wall biosynthesis
MRPILFIFTSIYPYGKGEEFLETEIPILSKFFDITIVPFAIKGNMRNLPKSVKVDNFFHTYKKPNRIFFGITIIHKIVKEYFESKNRYFYKSFSYFEMEKAFKKWFERYNNLKRPMIFYSYWFTQSTYALISLKLHYNHRLIIISRAHRGDLYEFANKYNYLPLRKKILKNIDKVFCISEDGKNYLSNKYPKYKNKIEVSRLGVLPQKKINIKSKDGIFRIVSCSYMVPVKRIHLIIDALYHISGKINRKILWTHIGNGPLEENLQTQAKKLKNVNIDYSFMGYLPNPKVQEYYKNNSVDLFLNVSESEGLPVSIMEALSFGIPVIATNVGGTKELIDDNVGKLLPSDISSEELSKHIANFIILSNDNIEQIRKNAFQRWNDKVNAVKNYTDFAKRLLKIIGNVQL